MADDYQGPGSPFSGSAVTVPTPAPATSPTDTVTAPPVVSPTDTVSAPAPVMSTPDVAYSPSDLPTDQIGRAHV